MNTENFDIKRIMDRLKAYNEKPKINLLELTEYELKDMQMLYMVFLRHVLFRNQTGKVPLIMKVVFLSLKPLIVWL